jgi:RNA polymerase sigma-70 factor, ECF subfamily
VYEELRRLARGYLRVGQAHTLQPTALVHEAYLKLLHTDPDRWQSREHFLHAAARAMRQILVDHARRRMAQKRQDNLPWNEASQDLDDRMTNLLHLEDGMRQLEAMDSELARLVELRFFIGCSAQEAADLMGIPERTARHRWGIAKAFLAERLSGPLPLEQAKRSAN